jgi:hypothetical protein
MLKIIPRKKPKYKIGGKMSFYLHSEVEKVPDISEELVASIFTMEL